KCLPIYPKRVNDLESGGSSTVSGDETDSLADDDYAKFEDPTTTTGSTNTLVLPSNNTKLITICFNILEQLVLNIVCYARDLDRSVGVVPIRTRIVSNF
ncbi:unnamed protein product, partial [Rotaria sp. Silwood2]